MQRRLTIEDKEQILEMYKCHYSAKEVAKALSFGYGTIIPYFRSFDIAEVERYPRINFIPKETNNDAECG